jgi:hypothetical protein
MDNMPNCGTFTDGDLNSPLLAGYDLAERKAILVHKYFLGIEHRCDPGLGNAVASWEDHYAALWRKQTHLSDCMDQIAEIELHRSGMISMLGQPVSWEAAAHDWITRFAAQWRQGRQQTRPVEMAGAAAK